MFNIMPSVEALSEKWNYLVQMPHLILLRFLTLFSLPNKRGWSFVNSLATEIV